jgi:hypothetical protein
MLDPLAVIVQEHDRFEIPYMLAGSFASTYHGSPRTTHAIDVVIAPSRDPRCTRSSPRERG